MILNRFIRSGRDVVILMLICIIVFMGFIIDSQVRTQMLTIAENNQLKDYRVKIDDWKRCFEKIAIFEVDGEKVIKMSDVQTCEK